MKEYTKASFDSNPLCGRNFEYYSEDPFLSGAMAADAQNKISAVAVQM